ncbi:protein kinase [Aeromonas dhakensis]|uniref:serine/threonine-protein kinase n=1 Tax=Aeromonas dhakensis TaxID=196024 RepID=UPI001A8BFFED|nr:protein kinase [Aeromonas dhakensis]QSR45220.1 protein kinase [Aeromonas dhakensis]
MLEGNQESIELIKALYPNFEITGVPKASGQRAVYFGTFTGSSDIEPENCDKWGEVVLKISSVTSRTTISYMEKEVEVLNQIRSQSFPQLFFHEAITLHPETEEPLNPIKFVSIEQRMNAQPLTNLMSDYNNEPAVISFLEKILIAMDCLWGHPQKLVHRDLKPDNILVRDDSSLVIIDLGLLRQEGSVGVTYSFCDFGPCTPAYASPEQAKNAKRDISFKSDLFSIGIICYQMLTGQHPFLVSNGTNYNDEILERICNHTPDALHTKGVDRNLSNIIEKMMNKEPYLRYRVPSKIINELNAIKELV